MSRRSQQFQKLANSGPIVQITLANGATGYARAPKTREQFSACLPTSGYSTGRKTRVVRNSITGELVRLPGVGTGKPCTLPIENEKGFRLMQRFYPGKKA